MSKNKPFVEIAFPIPARKLFTYRIPKSMRGKIQAGCRVYADFGSTRRLGYATHFLDKPPEGLNEIKTIFTLVDENPLFGNELLHFLNWMSDYYMASKGETYAAAYPFSPSVRPQMVKVVLLNDTIRETSEIPTEVKYPKQRQAIQFLLNRRALLSPAEIQREAGISQSTIKALEKKGFVRVESRERVLNTTSTTTLDDKLRLTEEQEHALEQIEHALAVENPKPILIRGVTGSGKTEIYLQSIDFALKQNKSALVLIPEIALTPQTLDRFQSRFGDQVAILHSGLGQGERYDEWRMIKSGRRKIVVGTRSAIFAPLESPGLIIVDEEHDGSYKQSDPSPRYSARDMAVARARLCGGLCLLGSATPSIESSHNAEQGKYHFISLNKRIASHGMPPVHLIDLRGRPEEEMILSTELKEALLKRYENGRQSILFLNRRGFATTLSCQHCGHVISCDHCSVAMVYHKSRNQLICHHCDFRKSLPENCPACAERFIRQQGFGTERVVQEIETLIPEARIIRMDRDTTRRKGDHDRLMTPFREGQADIMVGTQMIAKGLDFPNVTLVGIINADYALSLPDFRAAERTYAMLTQVAGRAGRGEHPGEVFAQSYCPDHYSIQLAIHSNFENFYNKEIRYRRLIGFPPFTRLVLWRVEAKQEGLARDKAWELYKLLTQGLNSTRDITLLPPVEAPLYRLRDYYRWQVALKSRDYRAFRPALNSESFQAFFMQRRKGLRIVQDVDPWDML